MKEKKEKLSLKKHKLPTMQEKILDSFCINHTGKMKGMSSVSTCCLENPLCIRNQSTPGSICQHCYAKTMQEMYKDLKNKDIANIELYTKTLIDAKDIPDVNSQWFRFESFGDIFNKTHLTNYMRIAEKNPKTNFALFTKNYGVAMEYFKENKCPKNVTLVISSMFLNKPMNIEPFYKTGAFEEGQCKCFTVYDYDYLKKHKEVNINCGSRSCLGCKLCYDRSSDKSPGWGVREVNEILKSDQSRAEGILIARDSKKVDEIFNILDLEED